MTFQITKKSLRFSKFVIFLYTLDIEVALPTVLQWCYLISYRGHDFDIRLVGRFPLVKEDLNGFSRII
jgi:hypothetical protein